MKAKGIGWLCCWWLTATVGAVYAGPQEKPVIKPPEAIQKIPPQEKPLPAKRLPDLKIKRIFVVTVLPGVEYTGVHVPEVSMNTPFDLCCEFFIMNATPPLPQDWKIGLFLDSTLHASVRGNDFSRFGHVCQPGGRQTVPASHSYECVLDHTGLVPESNESNNRGSVPFRIIP